MHVHLLTQLQSEQSTSQATTTFHNHRWDWPTNSLVTLLDLIQNSYCYCQDMYYLISDSAVTGIAKHKMNGTTSITSQYIDHEEGKAHWVIFSRWLQCSEFPSVIKLAGLAQIQLLSFVLDLLLYNLLTLICRINSTILDMSRCSWASVVNFWFVVQIVVNLFYNKGKGKVPSGHKLYDTIIMVLSQQRACTRRYGR